MTKDARLAVRLGEDQLDRIREAAEATGQTVSDFAVRTLSLEAANVLADRKIFPLSDAAWTELNVLIDRPIQHKPRLEKLLSAPSPFTDA
jgi:uncharacterized protein (DUF1778 family)